MIVFDAVTKVYEPNVVALSEVSFTIERSEFVFLVGASGSGKSTVIRLMIKELEPTDGRIIIGGRELARLKRKLIPLLRRNIGCVFQDFKLLPVRTTFGCRRTRSRCRANREARIRTKVPEVLNLVGLSHKMSSVPDGCSRWPAGGGSRCARVRRPPRS